MSSPRRIGILTSGGDAPGMNAAIRAVVRTAFRYDIEVVGYRDGYKGLVAGNAEPIPTKAVGNIIQRGGTILGTSRCPEFEQADVRAKVAADMRAAEVDALIAIGGDGTFRGAHALMTEHDVAVVGLPGTIDNDVAGTEETIGFHTAVDTAMRAIDRVRDTSEATGMMFFVEVMGRSSGAIAVATAVACGANAVLVPGACETIDSLVEHIRLSDEKGLRSHIIIVSEGDELGGAAEVAKVVAEHFDHPHRVVVLGHTQRGGAPVARDRIIATWTGERAVQALVRGRSGMMIGLRGGEPVEVPLVDVFDAQPPPFDDRLLQLALTTTL